MTTRISSLEPYYAFLETKYIEDEPTKEGQSEIRFFAMCMFTSLSLIISHSSKYLVAGACGPNSCSATATFVAQWLSEFTFSLSTHCDRPPFVQLDGALDKCTSDTLFYAGHTESSVLHSSNQS